MEKGLGVESVALYYDGTQKRSTTALKGPRALDPSMIRA